MKCPYCGDPDSKVVDSRHSEDGLSIRRRRECVRCLRRFTTYEVLETLPLSEYKAFSDLFEEDLYNDIDLLTCVEKRISEGGTSVASVEAQIVYVKEHLA